MSPHFAGVAQWLERHVANVNVEGSNPFTRSSIGFDIEVARLFVALQVTRTVWAIRSTTKP